MQQLSFEDFQKQHGQNKIMSEIEQTHKKGTAALFYSHNGADVAIIDTASEEDKKKDNSHDYSVYIIKNQEALVFTCSGYNNSSGDVLYMRTKMRGLLTKTSPQDLTSKGMYPSGMFYHCKEEDIDALSEAAKMYDKYQKETGDQLKVGDIFKLYVPGSFDSITRQLANSREQQNRDQQTQAVIDQQFKRMSSPYFRS